MITPDGGKIYLEGRDTTLEDAKERREEGLSHIPEDRYERGLVPTYPASMNVILGDHYHEPYVNRFGFWTTKK